LFNQGKEIYNQGKEVYDKTAPLVSGAAGIIKDGYN